MKFVLLLFTILIATLVSADSSGKAGCCKFKASSKINTHPLTNTGYPYLISASTSKIYEFVVTNYDKGRFKNVPLVLEYHVTLAPYNIPSCKNCYCNTMFNIPNGLNKDKLFRNIKQIYNHVKTGSYAKIDMDCGFNFYINFACSRGSSVKRVTSSDVLTVNETV